jgi:nucleotide-binding universal stress UspA family protein
MAENKGKPIVVAVDGSPPSWDAMETAISLARLMDRPIDVLHAVQLVKAGYFAFIDRHLKEEHEAQAQKVLAEAVERGQKAGVEVRPHLLQSEKGPSEAIIAYLTEAGPVKFLVLGSHGHGFMARHLLGSVTERVVREVTHLELPVPILIVPAGVMQE